MDSYDIGRVVYLVLLGAVVAGYFFAAHRRNLGQSLRQLLLWGLIFLGVIAGFGLWSDISRDIAPRQLSLGENVIEAPRRADGHFHLTLRVNDMPVNFVVDTGASNIVLGSDVARKLDISAPDSAYGGTAQTANGMVRTARVTLDTVQLGDIVDENVRAFVTDGDMTGALLGMDYLNRFSKIEIAGDRMVLTR